MTDRELLLDQMERYPELEVQDLVKCLYQSEFGCGHLLTESEDGKAWLIRERKEAETDMVSSRGVEEIGAAFSRVHLRGLGSLSSDTLYRIFVLSAQQLCGSTVGMKSRLKEIPALLGNAETENFLRDYQEKGCPALHHSERFREKYHPAYRVVETQYAVLLPLLSRLDEMLSRQKKVILALDGRCASGKTRLAAVLERIYAAQVIHMDDFFLQMSQRTPERLAEPGGNVDRERFAAEVLEPLKSGLDFRYRKFDCSQMALGGSVDVKNGPGLFVIEGSYSMHPMLAGDYDLSVFLDVEASVQEERILKRNGPEMLTRFRNIWIPMEETYIQRMEVPSRCALRFDGTKFTG